MALAPHTGPSKRVLITTPEYPPEQWGGLARTVGRVALHARDMGLDVHVAHLAVSPTEHALLDENRETREVDGVTVHRLTVGRQAMPSSGRDLWECPHTLTLQMMYQSLEKLQGELQCDLFHSFFLYPVGYVTGLLARRVKAPSVLTVVGNDIKKYIFSPEKVGLCAAGLDAADLLVALSEDLAEMADALRPLTGKARIIYNSVEIPTERWRPARSGDGIFTVGAAGIFKYAKGLPYLFKAVARASKKRPLRLELRGKLRDSERDIYRHMLQRTGLSEIVRLLDPLPHDRMPAWMSSLDVFVLPSVTEGCPNALMEALATGVPCVATRTGANDQLVQDGVSGLLVPWGDSAALAEAIEKMMENPGMAATMAAEGRERMRGFSAARERQAWENVYRELIQF